MIDLSKCGFYTMENARAEGSSATSPMWRCELIVTDMCNFSCPYCRGLRSDCAGEMDVQFAHRALDVWIEGGLRNVRFSGGEPLLYPRIVEVVERARAGGVRRIAISTNGSFPLARYEELFKAGVNDFSISLDACCAAGAREMSGRGLTVEDDWERLVYNIESLSRQTYVTVGVVVTEKTLKDLPRVVEFAHSLGVADIRIISAAQWNGVLRAVNEVAPEIIAAHPILAYRAGHIRSGRNVRGLQRRDSDRCALALDDSVIAGRFHFPCVIYMREGGNPIGHVGSEMRTERTRWSSTHDTQTDPICKANCLDVCIDYNNEWARVHGGKPAEGQEKIGAMQDAS
jgi:pyruvate-formate lyase-activating enzyme